MTLTPPTQTSGQPTTMERMFRRKFRNANHWRRLSPLHLPPHPTWDSQSPVGLQFIQTLISRPSPDFLCILIKRGTNVDFLPCQTPRILGLLCDRGQVSPLSLFHWKFRSTPPLKAFLPYLDKWKGVPFSLPQVLPDPSLRHQRGSGVLGEVGTPFIGDDPSTHPLRSWRRLWCVLCHGC